MSKFAIKVIFVHFFFLAGALTPQEILDSIRRHTTGFDNVESMAIWQDSENGHPKRWEEQKIYKDKLGRFHMVNKIGDYDASGTKTKNPGAVDQTDKIFDGEKTAIVIFSPTKDRTGSPIKSEQQKAGYRSAQIHDGKYPADGIADYRSPLTFVTTELVSGLAESLAAGRDVSIVETGDSPGMYSLTLSRNRGNAVLGSTKVVALLDSAKDWLPTRVDSVDDSGNIVRRSSVEYSRQNNKRWLPTKGSMKHYGNRKLNEVPLWEVSFDVKQMDLDNPNFDDSVFQIRLLPDTAISDMRYNVVYRVGDEIVFGNQLTTLAQKAIEERKASKDISAKPAPTTTRWIFIALNLAIVVVLFILIIWRRILAHRSYHAAVH